MEWLFVGLVLVLALVWIHVKQNRPPPMPSTEKELPDPQELLAAKLTEVAEAARREGRHAAAQAAELKVMWLKTRPLLGHDDPPTELSPNEQKHLRLAGDIWESYADLLADRDQPFAGCRFKPESMLPLPKTYVVQALEMLVALGEGSVGSIHMRARAIPPDVVSSMRDAREQLDGFVDVPAHELPQDPEENARYAVERGW